MDRLEHRVSNAAEAFDMPEHSPMELNVSLACAVPNGKYVEFIPRLDELTTSSLRIKSGMAVAPMTSGIGVEMGPRCGEGQEPSEFNCTFR